MKKDWLDVIGSKKRGKKRVIKANVIFTDFYNSKNRLKIEKFSHCWEHLAFCLCVGMVLQIFSSGHRGIFYFAMSIRSSFYFCLVFRINWYLKYQFDLSTNDSEDFERFLLLWFRLKPNQPNNLDFPSDFVRETLESFKLSFRINRNRCSKFMQTIDESTSNRPH